ncbi:hypothetical protein Pcinc_026927 [Petrolisthes cinctipes]|uniref:Uncharacterized protein n=1 Tax=Petrolisthes cinctipes TaxID=88211 RepID=A0AAE1F5R0_PETCI|nr:hypothetical protein Pcinc_026927 [Petrolisthes cinctipes]
MTVSTVNQTPKRKSKIPMTSSGLSCHLTIEGHLHFVDILEEDIVWSIDIKRSVGGYIAGTIRQLLLRHSDNTCRERLLDQQQETIFILYSTHIYTSHNSYTDSSCRGCLG